MLRWCPPCTARVALVTYAVRDVCAPPLFPVRPGTVHHHQQKRRDSEAESLPGSCVYQWPQRSTILMPGPSVARPS